jgi:damage-control phosphatase, subfamily I
MKIQTECVPCLLKRIVFESELSTNDKNLRHKTLKETCSLLAELYDPDSASVDIATKVHKKAYEILDDSDPYKKLKKKANKAAEKLLPRVEELLSVCDDPLRMSMLVSIVGNMMDFGIAGASSNPDDLIEIFEKTVEQDIGHDDYEKLKKIISKSKNIILFTDNSGEIVFDKILCREIKNFNPDIVLSLVVKGKPVLSDATMEDALEFELDTVVDEILTTGCFAVGVDFKKLPKKFLKLLENTDLIFCKGMGNYEAFSETDYKPIAYLLRTKCLVIAKSMNVSKDINVIKLHS